jgi:hypothetical protein
MKQGKTAAMILAAFNVLLILFCIVLYFRTDRTAPGIEFHAAETIYREGTENNGLLEGVTAYDSRDGDVTERIVIEKTIENREDNTVVVFYAASDKSGNVAKASRVFPAVYDGGETEADNADRFLEAGINAEMNQASETPAPAETESPSPVETPSPTAAPTPKATETPTPEPTAIPKPTVNPEAPVLTLKVSEVKVPMGQGPAWVDVIGTLRDDKDNYETLFKNLSVSKYNKDKAGTYQVSVYTEDSDGNKSQSVPLTIVVK